MLPAARRSRMMPEPTTAASSSAVPSASATTRRVRDAGLVAIAMDVRGEWRREVDSARSGAIVVTVGVGMDVTFV
jgi:hypothetical protein